MPPPPMSLSAAIHTHIDCQLRDYLQRNDAASNVDAIPDDIVAHFKSQIYFKKKTSLFGSARIFTPTSLLDAAADLDVHETRPTDADLRDAAIIQTLKNPNEPAVDVHTLQNEEDESVSKRRKGGRKVKEDHSRRVSRAGQRSSETSSLNTSNVR